MTQNREVIFPLSKNDSNISAMRITLTILLSGLWAICQGQMDWSIDDEFKGLVKSVKTTSFSESRALKYGSLIDSVADYNVIETRVFEFARNGKPIKHLLYRNESDTIGYCLWEYDKQERLIRQSDFRESDRLERTISYQYPNDTTTITVFSDSKGAIYSTWEKRIDSSSFRIRNFELAGGSIDDDYLTELDSSCLPHRSFFMGTSGTWVQNAERTHDEQGNLITYKYWNQDSSRFSHQEYQYDAHDLILETKEIGLNGKLSKSIHNAYDQFANVTRIVTRFPSGRTSVKRIDYLYDDRGNWTSKKSYSVYDSGTDYETSKSIRVIEYYDE